jgi:hypothetical protein
MNSRQHGLTASTLVIAGEDPSQFEALRAELMQEHKPLSALEFELVERLSGLLWRLRRIPSFEAAIIDARQAELTDSRASLRWGELEQDDNAEEMSDEQWSIYVGRALIDDGAYSDTLGKLARHEATLMNAFTKTLQMLLLLQSQRSNPEREASMGAIALPAKQS